MIQIEVRTTDPLTGCAFADDGVSVEFEGWLGLLRVLSDLLGAPPPQD